MPAARRPPSPTARGGAAHGGVGRATATPPHGTPPRGRATGAGTRPAGRPRPTSVATGPVGHEQVRLPRLFTARALVAGVVVVLAFVLVYPTLHAYLSERARLASLDRQVAAAQASNADLANQLKRWSDPAYVTSQARARLGFVLPGERAFRVADPGTVTDTPQTSDGPAGTLAASTGHTWYDDVWQSVAVAGAAAG